jgi:hypothetical protein
MSGLEDKGVRISGHLVLPHGIRPLEIHSQESSPLAAIGQLLNELGDDGWELVSFDTTTNRGVFKRPGP